MKKLKKITVFVVSFLVMFSALAAYVAAETTNEASSETVIIPAAADFNGDGEINSADVVAMLRHVMNPAKYPWQYGCDFNGDGHETVSDAIFFLKSVMMGTVDSMHFDCTEHAAAAFPEVAATCTATGYTGGTYCTVCGKTLTERTVVPAAGHNYADGVCTVCGDVKKTGTTVCTTEHNFVNNVCTNCGASYSSGLAYKVNSDGVSCTVTGLGTCADTSIIIPQTIDGYTVTVIGTKAFAETAVTSICIADTVTTIGGRAFYKTNITTITIPASVTDIGAQIISGCDNLTTVYYNSPYGNQDNTILNVKSVKKVVFGGRKVADYAMYKNEYVQEVEISDGVVGIGTNAFNGCSNLQSVSIPDTVLSIGAYAFSGCSGLAEIALPDSAMIIGNGAF